MAARGTGAGPANRVRIRVFTITITAPQHAHSIGARALNQASAGFEEKGEKGNAHLFLKPLRRAENYRWSSAAGHCGLSADAALTKNPQWARQFKSIGNWSKWLAEGDRAEQLDVLRRHIERGLPCGAEGFIRRLERQAKQLLRLRPRGRPKKV